MQTWQGAVGWSRQLACCQSPVTLTQGKEEARRRRASWRTVLIFSGVPGGMYPGLTCRTQHQCTQEVNHELQKLMQRGLLGSSCSKVSVKNHMSCNSLVVTQSQCLIT